MSYVRGTLLDPTSEMNIMGGTRAQQSKIDKHRLSVPALGALDTGFQPGHLVIFGMLGLGAWFLMKSKRRKNPACRLRMKARRASQVRRRTGGKACPR